MGSCLCELLLCIPSGKMRPKLFFCPTNEQSKLLSRFNDCKQNKYSLNMFSNFKNVCRMCRTVKYTWRREAGKKISPEESRKDVMQLAQHSTEGPPAPVGKTPLQAQKRGGHFTSIAQLSKAIEPSTLMLSVRVFPMSLPIFSGSCASFWPLLSLSDLHEKTDSAEARLCRCNMPKGRDIAPQGMLQW